MDNRVTIAILIVLLFCSIGFADVKDTAKQWFIFMIKAKPPYVMDTKIKPDDDIRVGVDCSRYGYLVFHWSGLPVRRVTAREMALGFGNWVGRDITLDDADECDIVWWTWKNKPDRPFGHVGYILALPNGLLGVTHASSVRGHIVHEKMEGVLLRDLVKTKRLKYFER